MSHDEAVLVIPTAHFHELGYFHGFTPDIKRYLPALLDPAQMRFLDRAEAEEDPEFKQLIPYVVLRCGDSLFHYTRGKGGGESRLHAKRSIGIGGHICSDDGEIGADVYQAGMVREVEEEVHLETTYSERLFGLINDDRTPVGKVHLGIVHVFDLTQPRVRYREEALAESGLESIHELADRFDEFETWSQFLLESSLLSATVES